MPDDILRSSADTRLKYTTAISIRECIISGPHELWSGLVIKTRWSKPPAMGSLLFMDRSQISGAFSTWGLPRLSARSLRYALKGFFRKCARCWKCMGGVLRFGGKVAVNERVV